MSRRISLAMVVVLLVAACGAGEGESTTSTTIAPSSTTTVATTTTPTTAATTTTSSTTTTTTPPPAASAPWSAAALAEAPDVVQTEWDAADNNGACSALYPAETPEVDGGTGTLRRANFSGGWGVAWDRDAGPGREPTGVYCEDCGRGAYGIAGVGVLAEDVGLEGRWPAEVTYDDGSLLGYGAEGFAFDDPLAPLLGELRIAGEGCLYQVWSFLGEEHLLALIDQLRFVEGLRSPTYVADEPRGVMSMGVPSWVELDPLPADDVSDVYFDEWAEAGEPASCPLLVFGDLGEAEDGEPRRALNEGAMLVAFDRPSGPGHDGSSEPCEDCGRGAIGIGTFPPDTDGGLPLAYQWDDGTVGFAEPRLYGIEAFIQPAGFDCSYWVWSHLGWEHLDLLLGGLRQVEGSP